VFVGVILIVVGAIALAQRFDVITGSVWSYAWPTIVIILGLHMLWGRRAGRRGDWMCGHSFHNKEGK
jgi:hypothetical protein